MCGDDNPVRGLGQLLRGRGSVLGPAHCDAVQLGQHRGRLVLVRQLGIDQIAAQSRCRRQAAGDRVRRHYGIAQQQGLEPFGTQFYYAAVLVVFHIFVVAGASGRFQ